VLDSRVHVEDRQLHYYHTLLFVVYRYLILPYCLLVYMPVLVWYYHTLLSITIVQSYTGNITSLFLLPWYCYECKARVTNYAKGDKRLIFFWYSFVAMVILILSYKRVILLHVPLPMNVANARYSLLGDAISLIFWFSTLCVSWEAMGTRLGRSHTERATRVQQLYSPVQKGCVTVWTSSTLTFGTTNK